MDEEFYSPSVLAYREAIWHQKKASYAVVSETRLGANECLLICTLAASPNSTYRKLAELTGINIDAIKNLCLLMSDTEHSSVPPYVQLKGRNQNGGPRFAALSEVGKRRHKEILAAGHLKSRSLVTM